MVPLLDTRAGWGREPQRGEAEPGAVIWEGKTKIEWGLKRGKKEQALGGPVAQAGNPVPRGLLEGRWLFQSVPIIEDSCLRKGVDTGIDNYSSCHFSLRNLQWRPHSILPFRPLWCSAPPLPFLLSASYPSNYLLQPGCSPSHRPHTHTSSALSQDFPSSLLCTYLKHLHPLKSR